MSAHAFRVTASAHGERLDRFVTEALRSAGQAVSRSEVQRWIEEGRVRVRGETARPADAVRRGEEVVVEPDSGALTEAEAEPNIAFDTLFTDEHLVVVNKPPGLVVHPAKGHTHGTLVNGLLARGLFTVHDFERDGSGFLRPGIVHRLDRGTSGVMVIARHRLARERLKTQFADHTILRAYEALVVGVPGKITYRTLHGRHPKDRLRFSTRVREGKLAITHVEPEETLAGGRASRITCRLGTGRTHQIRVHLSEHGHPVLGDPLYARPPKDPDLRVVAQALGHQALHARLLGFIHPMTQEPVQFEAEPPKDFMLALARLRQLSPPLRRKGARSGDACEGP